jgi:hypothetical protein
MSGAWLAVAFAAACSLTVVVEAQKAPAADVVAKFTGTWKLNRELSPSVGAPARGRSGRSGPALAIAGTPFQRGGGGRGGGGGGDTPATAGDLTPDVLAGQAAMRVLQQLSETVTIKASPESVSFSDGRGEQTYSLDGKNGKTDVNGTPVAVKSRWDKQTMRQEFTTPQMKLTRTWEVDENGRLVLKVRVESMTMNSSDAKAVYDRQP